VDTLISNIMMGSLRCKK